MFEIISFYFFSVLSLGLFAVSVFSKNVLYAMSALAGGMIFISGLFFTLGAEFLGVVQIMVYTGAIIVLYGFSMMFFNANKDIKEAKENKIIYSLAVISAFLLVMIFVAPILSDRISAYPIIKELDNIEAIGLVIFKKYLIVFELVAIMLLVAMICGIVLVHKNMDKSLTLEEESK
ncbi:MULTISPECIES: NADH-quinone oxidoreductase subunit J [Campylobacter]|uniref:NADH-quinone oxidoreductase subunit J n=1 Tax=Campylobacter TaxID=194 RepID=UPI0023F34F30|nr:MULTISPECIES: NADH-quinone oxidoreductase subunit J [Campylobacter]MCI6642037.1 NADH-quinone oxidoreductase subunit J [Campylobacter sp.]MDD7422823.1 NADH-quinone oxidoreductase subunit J [Campylobacter hominis]MDY3117878.1 NADH-quinone oxidoreductase subunit J [Campylobacter hominis]